MAGAQPRAQALLCWIPVGAGGHVVRRTSAWWERVDAARHHRSPERLVHAALELTRDGTRFAIEMAPAWGSRRPPDGAVAGTGPVGLAPLGRWRLFRYQVRCWPDGIIPDLADAVAAPILLTEEPAIATAVLDSVHEVPPLTWGRTVSAARDMWNSNSLVSWLLQTAGLDAAALQPPVGCRAPGWRAGIAVATTGHRR